MKEGKLILTSYFYVGAMLAAMAIISAWMFTSSKLNVAIRIMAASFVTVLAIAVWLNVVALLGFAVNGTPPDRSVVYSIVDAKEQQSIYLWISNKDGPRGYRLPYSDGLARELLRAKKEADEVGGLMVLHLKKGKKDNTKMPGEPSAGGGTKGAKENSPISADSPLDIVITVVPLLPPKI